MVVNETVGFSTDRAQFEPTLKEESTFRPLGRSVFTFEKDGDKYNVFEASFATEGFKQYNERMQIFVKLFIDSGSYIDDDPRWIIYALYRERNEVRSIFLKIKSGAGFNFCGFCHAL